MDRLKNLVGRFVKLPSGEVKKVTAVDSKTITYAVEITDGVWRVLSPTWRTAWGTSDVQTVEDEFLAGTVVEMPVPKEVFTL